MAGRSFGADPLAGGLIVPPGLLVLVVEDDESNRLVAEGALQFFRCRSQSAPHGAAALQALPTQAFDLILMDYHMPVMDGLKATRAIRAWERRNGRPRIPIVGLTGSAMPSEQNSCLEAGMDAVLAKPFQFEHLAEILVTWGSKRATAP